MISTSILRNVSFLVVREKARPDKKHFRKTQRLVVRGWWSAVVIMLLWSGVGGQLLSSCCCGQGLVVSYCHHVAVVSCWWSIAHTFFRRTLSRSFREKGLKTTDIKETLHQALPMRLVFI